MSSPERENYLKKRPVRVVWLARGPDGAICAHTFCFVGTGIPRNIRDEIASAADTRIFTKSVRAYFGLNDKEILDILGFDIAPNIEKRLARCDVAARVGGGTRMRADEPQDEDIMALERMMQPSAKRESDLSKMFTARQDSAVSAPPNFAHGGITFISDLRMFPEDSFADIKQKVFAATNIPMYRQHLAAITRDNEIITSYIISTPSEFQIDFRDMLQHEQADAQFGMPIDQQIYDAREELHVAARDHVTLIEHVRDLDFFVVLDLNSWTYPAIAQIRSAIDDEYQLDLVYYGYVVKYFPQLTRECFQTAVQSESELSAQYPDLAPSRANILAMMSAQCLISATVYSRGQHGAHNIPEMDAVITRASVNTHHRGRVVRAVNLRDLFDSIVCSKTISEVRAVINVHEAHGSRKNIRRYELRKLFKWSELMSMHQHDLRGAPSLGNDAGVMIIYDISDEQTLSMIIRATGRATFHMKWREEDAIDFDEMAHQFESASAQLIKELRAIGITNFEPVNSKNIIIQNLSIALRWHRTLSLTDFRHLRGAWTDYINAGIIIPRPLAKDIFSFTFTRGMSAVDTAQIDRRLFAAGIQGQNQYAYLSSSAVRHHWLQNFSGHVVTMIHRATDICFEILDIYKPEFEIMRAYIGAVISDFGAKTATSAPVKTTETRVLKRLMELDPVLYNLKKYGAPRVYSTRCQSGKQPYLYDEHDKIPAGAVKYWNFTRNAPAYYTCPAGEYKHFGFITGVHPLGYCIPCCGKLDASSAKHSHIKKICMQEHSFVADKLIAKATTYIMSYGRNIPTGRLAQLPPCRMSSALNRAIISEYDESTQLLLLSVPQDIAIVHTLRAILNLSLSNFIRDIVRGLESGMIQYDTITGGRASVYFTSKSAFIGFIASIAVGETVFPAGTQQFMRDVFSECAFILYGLGMIYLVAADQASDMRLIFPRVTHQAKHYGLAIIGQDDTLNPVFAISPDEYVRTNTAKSRTLGDSCAHILFSILKSNPERQLRAVDLEYLEQVLPRLSYTIDKLYISARGFCYAILARNTSTSVRAYYPISFCKSAKSSEAGANIARDSRNDRDITFENCVQFMRLINTTIDKSRALRHKYVIEGALRLDAHDERAHDVIGYIVRSGNERLATYCTGVPSATDASVIVPIDPRAQMQNEEIASGECAFVKLLAQSAEQSFYPYYEYDLFCAHFMHRCQFLRNDEMRARVEEIMKSSAPMPARRAELSALGLTKKDMVIITERITAKTKSLAGLSAHLDLDYAQLFAHIDKDTQEELREWLLAFMQPHVQTAASRAPTVPLVLASCPGAGMHCDGDKLIITSALATLVDILAADLRNPLKRAYIIARGDTIGSRAAFMDFAKREGEILIMRDAAGNFL